MSEIIEQANAGGQSDETISAIDAAARAAAARKAARATSGGATGGTAPAQTGEKKRKVLTAEERAANLANLEKQRAERKAARDKERAEKKAAKPAPAPAHMKKVEKAAAGLPALSEAAQAMFGEATAGLSTAELQALAAHLGHHVRVQATAGALTAKVEEGQQVKVTGGDPRFLGKVGTARKPGRIRVLVDFPGQARPGYFFTSDVTPVAAEPAAQAPEASAAEGAGAEASAAA